MPFWSWAWLVGWGVCWAIGWRRGHPLFGFLSGFVFGPIAPLVWWSGWPEKKYHPYGHRGPEW